jgi:hypothetical protein
VAVVKAAEARHPPTLPTRNVRGVRTIGATTARVRKGVRSGVPGNIASTRPPGQFSY